MYVIASSRLIFDNSLEFLVQLSALSAANE